MPSIKRNVLDQLSLDLHLPPEQLLEAMRLIIGTITAAPHGIAPKSEIDRALQSTGITATAPLLKALTDNSTIVWSYGCIEGWRMA